ncbi:elongation factor G 2, mitochondrial precursor, putative [Babesia bigemina]|uniref:Elongation factor G 2, mitochondrial, putative n=1 Tax=Babesia bigemina TaxID=5866 RepID=A0A061D526_BABBI|nr:elongation factor G 2, mitochondrial precursor, putative [Babesia bigemina]CDR95786.1 elongation factor G 2, mitochondrial precursor, putative [Babesia bigemina]|eukprot:XP_012767972.1 elongation factor G 2, mitochondrial precursor, putative [Babesia bigemina]
MGTLAALSVTPKLWTCIRRSLPLGGWRIGRSFSTDHRTSSGDAYSTSDIRNIGIVAHIDAGKTTLAEALLSRGMEQNRHGKMQQNPVQLDFMEQEIKRGITIRAACSSFNWGRHHINIIDTPGHTDFSGEVFNAMSVIGGCIIVIDGIKGVQAQTRHLNAALPRNMPKILFINKIDRPGVSIEENLQSIREHLRLTTVLINQPVEDSKSMATNRRIVSVLEENDECNDECAPMRDALTDCLCDIDDQVADIYLTDGHVPRDHLIAQLQKHVGEGRVTPVLCGSALTMAGVDQLLNAVCKLFPPPTTLGDLQSSSKGYTLVRTFKTVHGGASQIHAFCKVLKGVATPGMRLHNLELGKAEQAGKIFKIHGNTYQERSDILMISGMQSARTGHLLSTDPKKILPSEYGTALSTVSAATRCVCFATFTPKNGHSIDDVVDAMAKMKIEDPSVYYKYDPDAVDGLVVGGYGEFHLEILAEMLKDDYGIPVQIGKLTVALKESPTDIAETSLYTDATVPEVYSRHHAPDKTHIGIHLIMEPMEAGTSYTHRELGDKSTSPPSEGSASPTDANAPINKVDDENVVFLSPNGSVIAQADAILASTKTREILASVKQMLHNVLAAGPLIGGSMINTRVRHGKTFMHGISDKGGENEDPAKLHCRRYCQAAIRTIRSGAKATASRALKEIYSNVPIELHQPVVSLNIVVPNEYVGNVTTDLRRQRNANIATIASEGSGSNVMSTIVANVPMKHALGYTKALRALTNGNATFTMVPCGYTPVPANEANQ